VENLFFPGGGAKFKRVENWPPLSTTRVSLSLVLRLTPVQCFLPATTSVHALSSLRVIAEKFLRLKYDSEHYPATPLRAGEQMLRSLHEHVRASVCVYVCVVEKLIREDVSDQKLALCHGVH
jgi:hypothetical protein